MSTKKRFSTAEIRSVALQAAEAILIENGPQAVTLKAVAERIDRTHVNLLHHFGSATGLHEALAEYMAERHCTRIIQAITALNEGRCDVRQMVEELFDSNSEHGGMQLMTWLLLTGNQGKLDPVMQALKDHIDKLAESWGDGEHIVNLAIITHLFAMGDAVIGESITRTFAVPRDRPRDLLTKFVEDWLQATVGRTSGPMPPHAPPKVSLAAE